MNMNFQLAFEKLNVPPENRQTYFRYDDTNPEAESAEYISSLAEDVAWMGWKPNPTTFSSDYFHVLYDLAVKLIKRDRAYVCHQTKAEMEACREIARAKLADPNAPGDPCSPYRNRPIEESLKLFEYMRKGKFGASEATLRMKMDMTSPNPNMWDQVIKIGYKRLISHITFSVYQSICLLLSRLLIALSMSLIRTLEVSGVFTPRMTTRTAS